MERDGADYRFLSPETFERMRRSGRFLEWAKVHEACYGTPAEPITQALACGRDVVLSIDVQGARQIRRRFRRQAVLIFLAPPSKQDLRARLIKRHTDTPESIRRRLDMTRLTPRPGRPVP
jgi:guanylate kinase